MSELRQDPTTGNWVIVAPRRGARPQGSKEGADPVTGCPFCPGEEARTPPELWRLPDDGGWRIRAIPNKFPALVPTDPPDRWEKNGFRWMGGHGHHEVLIESPRHDWDLSTATPEEARAVLRAYRARYRSLRETGDHAVIVVFRNHGAASGTSLEHPHSQIVAAPVVPLFVRRRFEVARKHFDDYGTCLYVEMIRRELDHADRIVTGGERVVAFQPFAASAAFETWIAPRLHEASFGDAHDDVLDEMAEVLRDVLGGLRSALDDPPYNLVVHSAPPGDEGAAYFLWHVQIVPRLSTPAGFELGTGIPINPSSPEATAGILREAMRGDG